MKQQRNWRFLLLNIDVAIASIAMCVLVGLTFAGVVARYILGSPFTWIEEIQAAMIVWVIFGAAGAAFRTGNHAAVSYTHLHADSPFLTFLFHFTAAYRFFR